MKNYILVGLKTPPTENKLDREAPHAVLGNGPDLDVLSEFVAGGGIPTEWPYYAVLESDVKFYVLVSEKMTTEEICALAGDLRHRRWLELTIGAGPFDAPEEAYQGVDAMAATGVKFKGMHVGAMEDADAAQLKRWKGGVQ